MEEFFIQVVAGLVILGIGAILRRNAKAYQLRQQAGRDANAAQAERGAAVAGMEGVAIGNIQADGGGVVNQHIGDRHEYGVRETEEERRQRLQRQRNKKVYSLAIHILRSASGAYVSPTRGNTTLPGHLWSALEGNWFNVVTRITTHNGHDGRFIPMLEPNATERGHLD